MTYQIKPANPINNRLLIAIAGPQASGKTTSALRLATGIVKDTGGKICFIDTENKRALQYAGAFTFNHLELDPPFAPARYDEAIQFAENQGYGAGDVIIIDSMSHEHEGPGGVLEIHDEFMKSKNYNQKFNMLGWNHAKKGRKRLISYTLQRTHCNIILCFRAKQDLKEVQVNGKTQYVNGGLAAIGADEYFYEMNISFILPQGSMGKPDWTEKASRINEFGGDLPITNLLRNTVQISEETGMKLSEFSKAVPKKPDTGSPITDQDYQGWTDRIDKAETLVAIEEIRDQIKAVSDRYDDASRAKLRKYYTDRLSQIKGQSAV